MIKNISKNSVGSTSVLCVVLLFGAIAVTISMLSLFILHISYDILDETHDNLNNINGFEDIKNPLEDKETYITEWEENQEETEKMIKTHLENELKNMDADELENIDLNDLSELIILLEQVEEVDK